MKQILIKAALIITLAILLNLFLYSAIYTRLLPYSWGSNELLDKREFLRRNAAKYNSLFIGSSKTHNQIHPQIFDEKARENGLDIRSYNCGVGGLTPLESLHIYENLLLHDSLSFKYVFIELDWIATIKVENLNSVRSFYWLTPRNYNFSISSILNSTVPIMRSAWGLFHYSLNYGENLMNIGKVHEYFKYKNFVANQKFLPSDSNIMYNGYIPMSHKMNSTEYSLYSEVVGSARLAVRNYPDLVDQHLSQPYLDRLQHIISISKQRGIITFFIVPLQWKYYQYEQLIPIINKIKGARTICLFDIDRYANIYQVDNFADPNHLNEKGAKLYTEEIFNQFLKLYGK
ncbi:hypothetical protein [Segetibacter aerophilus]|uniref:DUF1574 domain-containing protein n=1 Tax=Segetibacter aerophilus TaxID=670293 RepID=A0A512BH01_9BACT|nr:hypothetical protein [Segetibacter aerophilus]GEO11246.1 hypothetical protein SAE01_37420 [Segetibacter aerophilus]